MTATPTLPMPVSTHVPTRLPSTPTPLPPTETPPPTGTPEGQIGPFVFPDGVDPLTGEVVANPDVLLRRPLAIKVSNGPACVRPQAGLAAADLVFEHLAEGGSTRFTAIYYGKSPGNVGSVRSARFIDLELPAMYDAILAYAGASAGVNQLLRASDFKDSLVTPFFGCPPFCRVPIETTACGLSEHTLFTNTNDLWAFASSRGLNTPPKLGGMVFSSALPAGGEPVTELTVAYTGSYVQWLYDANAGAYYRRQDGSAHADANTGERLTAENVVVVFVNHVVSDIMEDRVGYDPQTGQGGNYSIQIQLWGEGDAYLFRDGQAYRVKWVRFDRDGGLGLVFAEDHHVPLKPGNTWFQLVPLEAPLEKNGQQWRFNPKRPPSTPFGH